MSFRNSEGKTAWSRTAHRSLLFAPGNHSRRVHKVWEYGADVVVLDLEDAVPHDEKDHARNLVADVVASLGARAEGVAVRVNGVASGRLDADVTAVMGHGVEGIVVPKVESVDDLRLVDAILGAAERTHGVIEGSTWMLAIVESASGVVKVEQICGEAPSRLAAVCLGWVDLALDLGVDLTRDTSAFLYVRSRLAAASRAAGLDQPIDGPWMWLDDAQGLVDDSAHSRRLGFQGRIVIHPKQIDAVRRGYGALSESEVRRHREIVRSFETALAQGSAAIQIDGQFVDYPVYERSRHELRRRAAGENT